jgi:hypothetical protein
MPIKYNPSVNILRDREREINYIPTPNAKRVAAQIAADFANGTRTFNIIGSFGTGKSSFLWALEQTLRGKKHFFETQGLEKNKVEVLHFVGEFRSVSTFFAAYFAKENIEINTKETLSGIFNTYHDLGKKNPLLVLVIDEYGKFLEFAAKNNPEKELYFLQQLAEFVNNTDHNILLVTTLHQNFDAYSYTLNNPQRQEWTKVKGRFKEVTFNEPVDQLLYLAAERLSQSPLDIDVAQTILKNHLQNFQKTKTFALNPEFAEQIAQKLQPMDLYAAAVAALSLQKYGQNERSLFSFLESTDYTGIRQYDRRTNPFYNLSNLYDYLRFNFYSFLTAQINLDLNAWTMVQTSLERLEMESELQNTDCQKLVKSIGLLNIFASHGAKLDKDFWLEYAKHCLGLQQPADALTFLEANKIILYRNYANRYVLFEGTDVDINSELLLAGNQIDEISDISSLVNEYFKFEPVFAKEYYYLNGTPRVFEFYNSHLPKNDLIPRAEIDGFINLVFNERIDAEEVQKISLEQSEAVIYGFYRNSKAIKNLLSDIERSKKAFDNVPSEDRVARREIKKIQEGQETLLNHYILNNLYAGNGEVDWYFGGELVEVSSQRKFNTLLTKICNLVYPDAPAFKNELANRSKLSSQIQTAKGNYLRSLTNNWDKPDLGFEVGKFPPEKTIYLTLLKENGLIPDLKHPEKDLQVSPTSSFKALWAFSESFLEDAKQHRRRVSELTDALAKRPFKLKQGLIDFWVPSFLFIKRNEFALFGSTGYIPNLSAENLDLLIRAPQDFEVKTFDVVGVRLEIFNSYRQFLNQGIEDKPGSTLFVETIKPFLNFYRNLPDYSKNTKRLRKESLAVREAIANATDPEKTFFVDFPTALGTSLVKLQGSPAVLDEYVASLQDAIREVRGCYDELVNRFEVYLCNDVLYADLSFEEYQKQLRERFAEVKQHLLLPHQKTFLLRVSSELDDREAWLSSITQAVVGKNLKQLRDEDELALYDKFKNLVLELDSLTQISNANVNEEREEVFGLEISSFEKIEKKIVRFPKVKKNEIERIENLLEMHLGTDKTLNIAALVNVLKRILQK